MAKTTRKEKPKETCRDILEKCRKMAEMMKSCSGGEEGSFDCCEKLQGSRTGSVSKQLKQEIDQ